MPLYEYQCDACENRFERIQKFSDPPVAVCPACGGSVRKLVSSPAFQFKGTGWYVTDYARSGGTDKKGETAPDGKDAKDGKEAKGGKTDDAGKPAESKEPSGKASTGSSEKSAPTGSKN
jgi:putative FmdB family regulatory protein